MNARRQLRDFLLVVLAGSLLAVAGVTGYQLGNDSPPSSASAEAGFARDMSSHHAQAVKMALITRDRITDPGMRYLMIDIITAQQAQIGQMQAWLRTWGLTPTDADQPPMAWAGASASGSSHGGGHDMGGMSTAAGMPGMATQADLDRLAALTGRAAEIRFLQLMIAHHQGGVEMAKAALDRVRPAYERELAQSIVDSQQSEIGAMRDLLRVRGVASEPGSMP